MTGSERDFDRIARAWLDLGPNEAPDRTVAAVLQAIETTPQVRRSFRWPLWRSTTMTRITMIAAIGGALLIAIGALAISGGGPAPSVVPPAASASPAVSASASPPPLPSPTAAAVPDALVGGWVSAMRGPDAAPDALQILTFGRTAGSIEAPSSYVSDGQPFDALPDGGGTIRLTTSAEEGPCAVGDVGIYDYALTDETRLAMTLRNDDCSARAAMTPGVWVRSLAHGNQGGSGYAALFSPYMSLTLPRGVYSGRGDRDYDTFVAETATSTHKVWKDLVGFADPCDISKGRRTMEPGMDALLAYFEDDPRFEIVRRDEYEIDGRRAVEIEIVIGANLESPCWTFDGDAGNRNGVLTWVPRSNVPGAFWNDQIGGRDALVITEVDGVSLTFEFLLFDGRDFRVDRETLDTVRFLETLPTETTEP